MGGAIGMWSRALLSTIAALLLVGCQTIPALPGGQPSTMNSWNYQLRTQLAVAPVPVSNAVLYRPIHRCAFNLTRTFLKESEIRSSVVLSIKPVGDRLLVVTTEGEKTSTALIGLNGKLYDFNFSSEDSSTERLTPESYNQYAERSLAEMRSKGVSPNSDPHLVNYFSVTMPEYVGAQWNPDDTVAYVRAEDHSLWGTYQYRGMTVFKGEDAAVLDLTRVLTAQPRYGATLVGFTIVDMGTMLPLLFVLDAGSEVRLERGSCVVD